MRIKHVYEHVNTLILMSGFALLTLAALLSPGKSTVYAVAMEPHDKDVTWRRVLSTCATRVTAVLPLGTACNAMRPMCT